MENSVSFNEVIRPAVEKTGCAFIFVEQLQEKLNELSRFQIYACSDKLSPTSDLVRYLKPFGL